jgi:hypothetical protein
VLHCHLSSVRLYNNFSHHLINGYFLFLKNWLVNLKCVLRFSLKILSEPCLILIRTLRYNRKCILIYNYSGHIIIKFEFSLNNLEKYPNIKFHGNPLSRRGVTCGRTDRQTDMTKPIVAFRNFAKGAQNGARIFVAYI